MNIWYISKYASPIKYYFGTRHFYLAEEWVKKGHSVSIFTSNSSHLTNKLPQFKSRVFHEVIENVNTYWLNTYKSSKSSGISRILSWLHFDLLLLLSSKKGIDRPDIVIISSLSLTTVVPAWILARWYKAKFIFEVRDIWPLSAVVLGSYSKRNLFIRALFAIEKFGYEHADLIVGTMPNLKSHVCKVTSKAAKCICIPQGVNLDFYLYKQDDLPPEYIDRWIPKNKFVICYCGTINVNNPLDTLIETAIRLQNDERFHFILLGNGDKKESLKLRVCNLNNVTFPPTVNKNQVNFFLKHVNVCYDSFDSELAKFGLSRNKWIDYMYAAKPIICSYDGFQSVINEASCGSFVEFGNVDKLVAAFLEYASMSKSIINSIGSNGKAFLMRNRTFETLAGDYLENMSSL